LTSDNIYVVDAGNHRIQKFTNNGEFIATWGTRGTNEGQFICPVTSLLTALNPESSKSRTNSPSILLKSGQLNSLAS
jgi:hypothetical protein